MLLPELPSDVVGVIVDALRPHPYCPHRNHLMGLLSACRHWSTQRACACRLVQRLKACVLFDGGDVDTCPPPRARAGREVFDLLRSLGVALGACPFALLGSFCDMFSRTGSAVIRLAAASGEPVFLARLLASPIVVSSIDERGDTALTLTVAHGHVECMEVLLSDARMTHLMAITPTGRRCPHQFLTPLMIASQTDTRVQCLRALLAAGADPDQKTTHAHEGLPRFCTALMIAGALGAAECVRTLLLAHARTDAVNSDGCTALAIAAANGQEAALRLLLDVGMSDPNAYDWAFDSKTPLQCASERGCVRCVEWLLLAGAHVRGRYGSWTKHSPPLSFAVVGRHLTVVKALLAAHADANDCGSGYPPLTHAAAQCDTDAVDLLLAAGAEPDRAGVGGCTSLYFAVMTIGAVACVRRLLSAAADPNIRMRGGVTSLIAVCNLTAAASPPLVEVAQVLLDAKARVDDCDERGWTALMCAAAHDNAAIVEVLLTNGAAQEPTRVGHVAGAWTPLCVAVTHDAPAAVTMLLRHRTAPLGVNAHGWTPLGMASLYGNLRCTRALVEARADANAVGTKSCLGRTPMLLAAAFGWPCIVRLLLDFGADTEARDARGSTAVQLACGSTVAGCGEAAAVLVDHGRADARAVDGYGRSTVNMACACGNLLGLRAVLRAGAQPKLCDLSLAISKGHASCVAALLDASVSPSAFSPNAVLCAETGDMPLIRCCRQNQVDCARAVLMCRRVDPRRPNFQGDTPLSLAKHNAHMFSLLLSFGIEPLSRPCGPAPVGLDGNPAVWCRFTGAWRLAPMAGAKKKHRRARRRAARP